MKEIHYSFLFSEPSHVISFGTLPLCSYSNSKWEASDILLLHFRCLDPLPYKKSRTDVMNLKVKGVEGMPTVISAHSGSRSLV